MAVRGDCAGRSRPGSTWFTGTANLRTVTVIGGVSNFGLTGYAALLVLYFVQVLGLAPGSVGVILMLGGVGGLVGATVATRLAGRVGTGRASSTCS